MKKEGVDVEGKSKWRRKERERRSGWQGKSRQGRKK